MDTMFGLFHSRVAILHILRLFLYGIAKLLAFLEYLMQAEFFHIEIVRILELWVSVLMKSLSPTL